MRLFIIVSIVVAAFPLSAVSDTPDDPILATCLKYAEADYNYRQAIRPAQGKARSANNEIAMTLESAKAKAREEREAAVETARVVYEQAREAAQARREAEVAEARAAHDAAVAEAERISDWAARRSAVRKARKALREAERKAGAAFAASLVRPSATRDTARETARAAEAEVSGRARQVAADARVEVDMQYRAATKQYFQDHRRAYVEIYDGPRSEVKHLMEQVQEWHRERCRALYDL